MSFLDCFNGEKISNNEFGFELAEHFNGGFGGTNGGVLAAICVYVARDLAPTRVPIALDTRFIRGFRPGLAKIKTELLNSGRSLSVVSVDIFNDERKLCVRSTITLVEPGALAGDLEHQDHVLNHDVLLPMGEGKLWPQNPKQKIPLIDCFHPAYLGKNEDGVATAVDLLWEENGTLEEAACIAADISVGPPVAGIVRGKASIPNPDLSLRFCVGADAAQMNLNNKLISSCKTENIQNGLATNRMVVSYQGSILAFGISTTTCMKL